MEQIFGKGVSKGVAAGPISFYRRASGVIPRHEVSDTAAELAVGDRFVISRAANHTKICKLHQRSFLEILRKKMGNYS